VTFAPERGVVVVVAYAGDELPIMWGSLADFEIVDGGSLTITAFQPVTTQTIELTGIPSSVSRAQFSASTQIGDAWIVRPLVRAYGAPVDGRLTATGPWAGASDRIIINSIFEGVDYGSQHTSGFRPPRRSPSPIRFCFPGSTRPAPPWT
jgi:hypothetical protein